MSELLKKVSNSSFRWRDGVFRRQVLTSQTNTYVLIYRIEIGEDSSTIRGYFARYGAVCSSNVNPAEYMLEAIGAGKSQKILGQWYT